MGELSIYKEKYVGGGDKIKAIEGKEKLNINIEKLYTITEFYYNSYFYDSFLEWLKNNINSYDIHEEENYIGIKDVDKIITTFEKMLNSKEEIEKFVNELPFDERIDDLRGDFKEIIDSLKELKKYFDKKLDSIIIKLYY